MVHLAVDNRIIMQVNINVDTDGGIRQKDMHIFSADKTKKINV